MGLGQRNAGLKMIFGQKNDSETLRQTFRTACDLGFTLWDTAEVYGMGESEKYCPDALPRQGLRAET